MRPNFYVPNTYIPTLVDDFKTVFYFVFFNFMYLIYSINV